MCLDNVGADGEQQVNTSFCSVFFSHILNCSMTCWAFAGEGLRFSSGFVQTGAGFIGLCRIYARLNSWVLLTQQIKEYLLNRFCIITLLKMFSFLMLAVFAYHTNFYPKI